jgi:hypothetical protein
VTEVGRRAAVAEIHCESFYGVEGLTALSLAASNTKPERRVTEMDFAGLSDERRGPHIVVPHRSNVASDRRARAPHGPPAGSGTVNRPASGFSHPAAAPEIADHRQADYFLGLLTQRRRVCDDRIGKYQQAIAIAEGNGDVEGAGRFRPLLRIEQQDRQVVDGLIENLHRRFPLRPPGEVRSYPRKAPLAVVEPVGE